ncbi:MAG: hypothetical protein GY790_15235 [Bacteroidetes bacterium]|nr:hypothetical protein [Bacteroidota bacterium]
MKYLLYPFTILMFFASCATQDTCDADSQAILVARFKTEEDGRITDTIMEGMSIYGIREGKTDSLLYNAASVSRIELPLDPNNENSKFMVSNGIRLDTLLFTHSSEAYLISYTCGFAARFTLDQFSAPGSWMVDMQLIKGEIDAEFVTNEEHLWIYF